MSGAGNVCGVSAGTAIITYVMPTSCQTTKVVTVTAGPSAISVVGGGGPSLCAGYSL